MGSDHLNINTIYFNPLAPIDISQGDLPHWEQQNCTYFVTFRLADSIPKEKLSQWQFDKENWLFRNPPPHDEKKKEEYHQIFGRQIEYWLKQGYGSCLLADLEAAKILAGAMKYFHLDRYFLLRAVIMTNHTHALVTPSQGNALRAILHSWKSFSANKINVHCGRRGALWQRETFDTIIRDAQHLERVLRYLDENAASPAGVMDIDLRPS